MGLLDKLKNNGSVYSLNNGANPTIPNLKDSTLHNQYSVNGRPVVKDKPSPSTLDLGGETPSFNYRKNAPEGKTF